MPQMIVTVPLLNKRKYIPATTVDKGGIIGIVKQGYVFTGVEEKNVPDPTRGKWYKDGDGYFYWGGGLAELPSTSSVAKEKNRDWCITDYGIEELWKHTKGEGIKVAVLDTGLQLCDDFVKERITFYNVLDGSGDCTDTDGHGTDCAALICGQGSRISGVAPDVNLQVVKIRSGVAELSTQNIVKALQYTMDNLKPNVLSLSFYTKEDEHLPQTHKIIEEAVRKDTVVVAAAGNSGGLSFPVNNYPASFPESLSVGGVDRNRIRSRFSTKSNCLDIMGPGEDIASLFRPAQKNNGTSFAAPFVAGVVALLLAYAKKAGKNLSVAEIHDVLKRSASQDIPNNGYNSVDYGWGILQPVKALHLLRSTYAI